MRIALLLNFVLAFPISARATDWYVSGIGHDEATGLDAVHAFRTLQHAADQTRPGDTVLVFDGTYLLDSPTPAGDILFITRSGTPGQWITYKAAPGQHPTLESRGWNAVEFGPTAAYIHLEGFTINGNNQSVSREEALHRGSAGKPTPDPRYDGNCIVMDGRKGKGTARPHHIRILHNVIGNCGGGGIATIQADYITIAGNTVFNSAWYSIFGCSGISTLEDWNSDDSTETKMVIQGNLVFNNRELVPWIAAGKITDGEGIIVDTLRSPTLGKYRGRTLVADNVLYGNGSAAIEVFRSDHVDILNNSTNDDLQVAQVSGNGELNLNDATDVQVANNILVSAAARSPVVVVESKPCDCKFSSNLLWGGTITKHRMANTLVADPKYVSATDLRLTAASPAAGSADKSSASPVDFYGHSRPYGPRDLGAYQR